MAVILSMRLLVLLLAVLFVNADVVQITDSNFAAEVSSNPEQLWMLMFGADWVPICRLSVVTASILNPSLRRRQMRCHHTE